MSPFVVLKELTGSLTEQQHRLNNRSGIFSDVVFTAATRVAKFTLLNEKTAALHHGKY